MSPRFDELINQPRDSVKERKFINELKQLPEQERVGLLKDLIERSPTVGLYVAKRASDSKDLFYWVLERALRTADASRIYYWLDRAVSKLGFVKTVGFLIKHIEEYKLGVKKAAYWLPRFRPDGSAKARAVLDKLNSMLA